MPTVNLVEISFCSGFNLDENMSKYILRTYVILIIWVAERNNCQDFSIAVPLFYDNSAKYAKLHSKLHIRCTLDMVFYIDFITGCSYLLISPTNDNVEAGSGLKYSKPEKCCKDGIRSNICRAPESKHLQLTKKNRLRLNHLRVSDAIHATF